MTLVEGDESRLGRRSMAEWAVDMFHAKISLDLREDITTSLLLKKGEGIIKKAFATYFPRGKYLGPSRLMSWKVGTAGGEFKFPPRGRAVKMEPVDKGEFLLTNQRLIFNGTNRIIEMELPKVISVDIRGTYLEIGYGDRKHTFQLGKESLFKWKTYIDAIYDKVVRKARARPKAPMAGEI